MVYFYDLTLGLPHTNHRGLAEPLLLQHAGHFQWTSIAAATGGPLSLLRTAAGGEVYAAFYYIEERFPAAMPAESFGLDDEVRFAIALRSFKNIAVEGRIVFGRPDRLADPARIEQWLAPDAIDVPLPFIRSIGIGGMLIPAVSVLAAITLLPALLAVLGERINSVRLLPKRLVDHGHPEDGPWGRWARFVNARPLRVAALGLAITGVLVYYGFQLNPNEAQLKNIPGQGDAIVGRDALTKAGISPGVLKPLSVLVENGGDPAAVAERLRHVDGITAAVAPNEWRKGDAAIVEAFPAIDGAAPGIQAIINRSKAALKGTNATVSGTAAVERDLVHAIYGNFPYLLAFVLALTYILLARAFRSLVLPLKAVILNLVSLAAAFGIVVIVFQLGHGSGIWGIDAMQAINPWIPMMIFAFLFGLSMDYEVFMLTRMREAYDETGSTPKAIELGLARTGKLVTSAALVLMCAFLVLSTGPGFLIKELAIGLAAGIIFDATVVRALLVPALMRLLGDANWWMPPWAHRPLLIQAPEELPEAATEST